MSNLYYLQDARSYVGNDILFWAKTGGYTTDLSNAKVFTEEKAMKQHKCRPDVDIPWPKEYLDGKTRPAVDMQYVNTKVALRDIGIKLIAPPKPKKETYRCDYCGKFCTEEDWYAKGYHGWQCSNCEE